MEVSAKSNINVEKAFFQLAGDIKKRIADSGAAGQQGSSQNKDSVNVAGTGPMAQVTKNCC